MSILSGYKKFKKYIKTSSGFQLQSLWSNANTVEADDGKNMETKVGAINGITSSTTANSTDIAASANLVNTRCNELSNNLEATDNKFGGCTLEQEGNDFYITGADAVRKKLGNDDVRMFTLSFPNADGTYTLDNLDVTGDPNFISVSTANNVWVDAVYNAIAPCGQTGVVSDKVKMCAYAISQTIQYLDKSDVFPVCTKDTVTINYSRFKSGVGDKTTRVVIAHF